MKLIDYIQGKRHGKDANRLEREALNDPFLQDAIDGFDSVPGDHIASINQLEEDMKRRISRKPRVFAYRWWAIGIAASIILVLGIGSLMHMEMNVPKDTALRAPKVIIPTKTNSDSVVHINAFSQKTIARLIPKKKAIKFIKTDTVVEEVRSFSLNDSQQLSGMMSEIAAPVIINDRVSIKSQDSLGMKNIASNAESVLQGKLAGVAVTTDKSPSFDSYKNKSIHSEMATLRKSGKITGKVLDENGEPLIGATVNIKGYSGGTVTDTQGYFEIKTPVTGKEKLVAKYIGYNTKEIALTDNLNDIKLKPNDMALNEVVVVGYGTVKKSNMTGAIASIRSEKPFGENEFKTYYQNHRTMGLCNVERLVIKASFSIDKAGKPTDIKVDKASCPEMQQEFIKCLQNSPVWTQKNRKVRIIIRF
jgi:hypothetical protein